MLIAQRPGVSIAATKQSRGRERRGCHKRRLRHKPARTRRHSRPAPRPRGTAQRQPPSTSRVSPHHRCQPAPRSAEPAGDRELLGRQHVVRFRDPARIRRRGHRAVVQRRVGGARARTPRRPARRAAIDVQPRVGRRDDELLRRQHIVGPSPCKPGIAERERRTPPPPTRRAARPGPGRVPGRRTPPPRSDVARIVAPDRGAARRPRPRLVLGIVRARRNPSRPAAHASALIISVTRTEIWDRPSSGRGIISLTVCKHLPKVKT